MRNRSTGRWLLVALVAGCGGGGDGPTGQVPGYLATDDCSAHADEASCAAEPGCEWIALGIACEEGAPCVSGVCSAPDACRAFDDEASCAEAGCAWAGVELCPPPGDDCPDGFCYTPGDDGCACVCPAYCPPGEDCPPCECDCSGGGTGGGGGGTCTCDCPPCAPGEVCEPCGCDCGGGDGCVEEGTCTCVCPDCAPGAECPPCECSCDDGGGGVPPTDTCECAPCAPGETCEPCACEGSDDPCLEHADEEACAADLENACTWYAFGRPCVEGEPCVSGVCQSPTSGGGDGGCACVCPDCPPDTECAPCECAGTGGGDAPPPEGP